MRMREATPSAPGIAAFQHGFGLSPLWCDFPFASADARLCNFPTRRQTDQVRPYNPHTTTTAVYHVARVWVQVL
jgi:hypothetical protein